METWRKTENFICSSDGSWITSCTFSPTPVYRVPPFLDTGSNPDPRILCYDLWQQLEQTKISGQSWFLSSREYSIYRTNLPYISSWSSALILVLNTLSVCLSRGQIDTFDIIRPFLRQYFDLWNNFCFLRGQSSKIVLRPSALYSWVAFNPREEWAPTQELNLTLTSRHLL